MTRKLIQWLLWFFVAFELLAALMPVVSTGFWAVRLFDFPRLQLLQLTVIPFALIGWLYFVDRKWSRQVAWCMSVLVIVVAWQTAQILPYTPVWTKELPDASRGQTSTRIVVANLNKDSEKKAAVLQSIKDLDAELVLLIEYDKHWQSAMEPLRKIYPYREGVVRGEGLGIVLWSKLKLENAEVQYLVSERRASVFADVILSTGQKVRFAGVHPTPPGLKDSTGSDRRDSRVRDAELLIVAKHVKKHSDAAWIVAGDFNDVAWSHTTQLFSEISGLRDPRIGRQLLCTYPSRSPLMRYPIDHIFLSDGFAIASIKRVFLPGSDHFAIVTDATLGSEAGVTPTPSQEEEQEAAEIVKEGVQDAEDRDIESDEAE